MSLQSYFSQLIKQVESSEEITNAGTDAGGFYKPTRTIVLRHLNLLRDLCDKPRAKPMLQASWKAVVEVLPPEWLILTAEQKQELQQILKPD